MHEQLNDLALTSLILLPARRNSQGRLEGPPLLGRWVQSQELLLILQQLGDDWRLQAAVDVGVGVGGEGYLLLLCS